MQKSPSFLEKQTLKKKKKKTNKKNYIYIYISQMCAKIPFIFGKANNIKRKKNMLEMFAYAKIKKKLMNSSLLWLGFRAYQPL